MRTFLNFPRVRPDEVRGLDAVVFGIPFDKLSFTRRGSKYAPDAIRRASRIYSGWIPELHVDISEKAVGDSGNVKLPLFGKSRYFSAIMRYSQTISSSEVPFVALGGDHSITLPIIRSLTKDRERLGLLWLDAHLDFMKEYPKGYTISHATVLRRIVEMCGIDPHKVVVLGFRGYASVPYEYDDAKRFGIEIIGPRALKENVHGVLKKISEKFEDVDGVYISLDVDVIDPAWAPAVSTPEVGGLAPTDVIMIIRGVDCEIVGCDLVEVTPPYDRGGITCLLGAILVIELLARLCRNK